MERPGTPMEIVEGSKQGSKAAICRYILEAAASDTDNVGEGGLHEAKNGEGGGTVVCQGNYAANSSGVEGLEGDTGPPAWSK